MTLGEKLKNARLSLNMSQSDLAKKTGISERSLYTYEHMEAIPRTSNIKKLADALNVTVTYLMDEEKSDTEKDSNRDIFLANVKNEYGSRGAREASEVLDRASALFAGGELDDEAKEVFFRSLMEIYLDSKAEAKEKFTPRQRASKKTDKKDI